MFSSTFDDFASSQTINETPEDSFCQDLLGSSMQCSAAATVDFPTSKKGLIGLPFKGIFDPVTGEHKSWSVKPDSFEHAIGAEAMREIAKVAPNCCAELSWANPLVVYYNLSEAEQSHAGEKFQKLKQWAHDVYHDLKYCHLTPEDFPDVQVDMNGVVVYNHEEEIHLNPDENENNKLMETFENKCVEQIRDLEEFIVKLKNGKATHQQVDTDLS